LTETTLEREGDRWSARCPEGTVKMRFSDRNESGVMDHCVDLGADQEAYVPMRVVPNVDGVKILLTLSRQLE
jgi:hypothetical protein